MNNKPVLFVHVPKTGGTSVINFLRSKSLDAWKRSPYYGFAINGHSNHDPYFFLQENNVVSKDTFVFSIVRNPYSRMFSYYKHFNKSNNLDYSFYQFLRYVQNNRKIYNNMPSALVFLTQSFFLLDMNGNMSIDKIYRFESLHELEKDFDTKLPVLNFGGYSQEEYFDAYKDERNINLVKNLFLVDFINFDYSLDFSRSFLHQ